MPCRAENAATMPLLAAFAGFSALVMVPRCPRSPLERVLTMPMAFPVCSASRPSSRAAVTAAPNAPVVPVRCQPWSRCAPAAMATRDVTSRPATWAASSSAPLGPRCSATASPAAVTGELTCTIASKCVSSKSRTWEA